jgi:hypothetical protein
MLMMKRIALATVVVAGLAGLVVAPAARGQRRVIGGDDEEQPADAGPPAAAPAKKKGDDKKPDAKAPDAKPAPDAKAAADAKKGEDKKAPDAKAVKKGAPVDVLADTPAEKETKSKAVEAKEKADAAAEEAAHKKEEEQRKLQEEKKAADAKKKLENRDQRLAAAKKIRQITRTSGSVTIGFAVEPGYAQANSVLEVRVAVAEKLDVPDPRYGDRMPLKGLDLVATVSGNGKKLRYAVHPLDAPGRYGFHTTPLKDGTYLVSVDGTTADHKSVSASFPLHVGTWPPPDFDTEEQNNLTSDAARNGRKVLGEN